MSGLSRMIAIFRKELVQMRWDRPTFAVMIMVPVMQLALFGFAIDTDPRMLPTAVVLQDDGPMTRALLAGMRQSTYFDIERIVGDVDEGERLLRSGAASFVVVAPENFERDLVRGDRPALYVAADASDPVASAGPVAALQPIATQAFAPFLAQVPGARASPPAPFDIVVHRQYNPTGETTYNIVPGLLGVILTMTLIMITSIALTREVERGTIEALLSTPVLPHEVMIGKTTPYLAVGAIQTGIVLAAARLVFDVPFEGSPGPFAAAVSLFVFTNLMIGYLISTVARTQMQAMQMTFFVFLPSILLSGFMFPFAAMPGWAQMIGEALPITHFLRIAREVMLKGAGFAEIGADIRSLAIILAVVSALALLRFRRTLD